MENNDDSIFEQIGGIDTKFIPPSDSSFNICYFTNRDNAQLLLNHIYHKNGYVYFYAPNDKDHTIDGTYTQRNSYFYSNISDKAEGNTVYKNSLGKMKYLKSSADEPEDIIENPITQVVDIQVYGMNKHGTFIKAVEILNKADQQAKIKNSQQMKFDEIYEKIEEFRQRKQIDINTNGQQLAILCYQNQKKVVMLRGKYSMQSKGQYFNRITNFGLTNTTSRTFNYLFGLNEKKLKMEKATKLYETYLEFSVLKDANQEEEIEKINSFFIKYQIYKRLAKKFVLTQTDTFKYNENDIFDADMELVSDIFSDYDIQEQIRLSIEKNLKTEESNLHNIIKQKMTNYGFFCHLNYKINILLKRFNSKEDVGKEKTYYVKSLKKKNDIIKKKILNYDFYNSEELKTKAEEIKNNIMSHADHNGDYVERIIDQVINETIVPGMKAEEAREAEEAEEAVEDEEVVEDAEAPAAAPAEAPAAAPAEAPAAAPAERQTMPSGAIKLDMGAEARDPELLEDYNMSRTLGAQKDRAGRRTEGRRAAAAAAAARESSSPVRGGNLSGFSDDNEATDMQLSNQDTRELRGGNYNDGDKDDENIIEEDNIYIGGKLSFNNEKRSSGNRKFNKEDIDFFMKYFKIITYNLNTLFQKIIDGDGSENSSSSGRTRENFMNKYLNKLIGEKIKDTIYEDDDGVIEKYKKGIVNPQFLTEKLSSIDEYIYLAKTIIGNPPYSANDGTGTKPDNGFLRKLLTETLNPPQTNGASDKEKIQLFQFGLIKEDLMNILIEHVTNIAIVKDIGLTSDFSNKLGEKFRRAINKKLGNEEKEKELSQENIDLLDNIFYVKASDPKTIQEYKKKMRRIDDIIESQKNNETLSFVNVFNELINQEIFTTQLEITEDGLKMKFNGENIVDEIRAQEKNEPQKILKLLEEKHISKTNIDKIRDSLDIQEERA